MRVADLNNGGLNSLGCILGLAPVPDTPVLAAPISVVYSDGKPRRVEANGFEPSGMGFEDPTYTVSPPSDLAVIVPSCADPT